MFRCSSTSCFRENGRSTWTQTVVQASAFSPRGPVRSCPPADVGLGTEGLRFLRLLVVAVSDDRFIVLVLFLSFFPRPEVCAGALGVARTLVPGAGRLEPQVLDARRQPDAAPGRGGGGGESRERRLCLLSVRLRLTGCDGALDVSLKERQGRKRFCSAALEVLTREKCSGQSVRF